MKNHHTRQLNRHPRGKLARGKALLAPRQQRGELIARESGVAESDAALRELIAKTTKLLPTRSLTHTGIGMTRITRSNGWSARQQRDAGLPTLRTDLLLKNLHSDSRWNAFLRTMGLTDDQLKTSEHQIRIQPRVRRIFRICDSKSTERTACSLANAFGVAASPLRQLLACRSTPSGEAEHTELSTLDPSSSLRGRQRASMACDRIRI